MLFLILVLVQVEQHIFGGTGIDISGSSISLDSNIKGVILGVSGNLATTTNVNVTLSQTPYEPSNSQIDFTTTITVPSGLQMYGLN